MLVKSANDMAVAVAETVAADRNEKTFVAQMNLMAQQMGMTATHYDNANGLKSPGQISTARDLAMSRSTSSATIRSTCRSFQTQNVQLGIHKLETSNAMLHALRGAHRHEDRLHLPVGPQYRRHGRA